MLAGASGGKLLALCHLRSALYYHKQHMPWGRCRPSMYCWLLQGLLAKLHWAAAVRARPHRLISHLWYSMHFLQRLPRK